MTGKLIRSIFNPLARSRYLAALVLFTLAVGAVAEFTHSHQDRAVRPANLLETSVTADANDALIRSSDANPSSSRSKSAAECLICQLHQNLSNTTVTHALTGSPTEAQSFASSAAVNLHRADFSNSRRGRAPPTIL